MLDWSSEVKEGITALEYLKQNYKDKSDRQIGLILSELVEESVSKDAVKAARIRNGWKKGQVAPTQKPQPKETETQTGSATFEVDGNYAEASCRGSHVDELIKKLQIDMEIWELKSFKVWQGFAKVEGEIETIPLVSASFIRRELQAEYPVIHPIKVEKTYSAKTPDRRKKVLTELVFSDPHFGYKRKSLNSEELISFHDEGVLQSILDATKEVQPDQVRIVGDILDLPEFSDKFLRSPEFAYLTQPAINSAHAFLVALKEAAPKAQIIVHFGNHDKRVQDMLFRHLPFAYGIKAADELNLPPQFSIERLLALDSLGIVYSDSYPNDYMMSSNGVIEYLHGTIARGDSYETVKAAVKDSTTYVVMGHIHRDEKASLTIWQGGKMRVIEAHSFGCACKIDGTVPGRTKRQNWQNGFGIIKHTAYKSFITHHAIDPETYEYML